MVVRIKEDIGIVFSSYKGERALPKHNNKYYKIRKFSITTLFRSVVSRGFRALLHNSQLLQFSISVSSYSSCLYTCLLFLSFHSLSEKKKKKKTHIELFFFLFLELFSFYLFSSVLIDTLSMLLYGEFLTILTRKCLIYWWCSYIPNTILVGVCVRWSIYAVHITIILRDSDGTNQYE